MPVYIVFNYYFKVNLDIPPTEVSKDFQGNGEFRIRIQHLIYLERIRPTAVGKGLQVEEPKTYDKVMEQNDRIGEEFIMEISPKANKALAEYIYNAEDPANVIKLKRTGSGNQTVYNFTKGH